MRSKHTLKEKQAHMVLCQNCYFLPTQQQLPFVITSQTIFELLWTCPFCNFSNCSSTDHQFKYYTISNQGQAILDQSSRSIEHNEQRVIIMIDVGYEMAEVWQSGAYDQLNRANGLLAGYLKTKAVQLRSKIGQYFSWQNFLKKNQITKIEYAFALTDYLSVHIPNLQIQFFLHKQDSAEDSQIDEKLTILPQNFLKTIKHENGVRNIKYLLQMKGQKELIVISANCLQSIAQTVVSKRRRRTLLINLQQKISAISLLPTSTASYEDYRKETAKILSNNQVTSNSILNHSNNGASNQYQQSQINPFYFVFTNRQLYIFDPPLLNLPTACGFELVSQILMASQYSIGVFGLKVKSGGEDKWQQIIDGCKYCQYLEQHYSKTMNQDQSSSLKVCSEKSKQKLPILIALRKMSNKKQQKSGNSRSNAQIQELLELVQSNLGNRYQEMRVCLRFVDNQTVKGEKVEVSRTILWKNYSKIGNAGDKKRAEDQFQYFWKRCPAIARTQRIKKIGDYGIQCQVL